MKLAIDSLLLGIMLVLAAMGFILSFIAYWRSRQRRLLFVSSALLLLLIKSILLISSLFWSTLGFLSDSNYHVSFDIAVVILIILAGLWE